MSNFITRQSCPVCSSDQTTEVLRLPFTDPRLQTFLKAFYGDRIPAGALDGGEYEVVQCDACLCAYQKQVLNDDGLSALYETWIPPALSLAKKTGRSAASYAGYIKDLWLIERLVGRPAPKIRLLEFGMGWGFFARLAKALNFDVIGAELSKERIAFAESQGVPVTGDIRNLPEAGFDAIYSDQVFEHLEAPGQMIVELGRIVKPGGVIIVKVPDDEGVLANLRSPAWRPAHDGLHPLEHINLFAGPTFEALGRRAGLTQERPPAMASILEFRSWLAERARSRRQRRSQSWAIYRKPADARA